MRLFFDADVGTGVPKAVRELEINDCLYMEKAFRRSQQRPANLGQHTKDEIWIPRAGKYGWLVVSCNKAILTNAAQRQLWIDNKVGGVFLTSGQDNKVAVFDLIRRRMEWLTTLDTTEPRPFAYLLPLKGKAKKEL